MDTKKKRRTEFFPGSSKVVMMDGPGFPNFVPQHIPDEPRVLGNFYNTGMGVYWAKDWPGTKYRKNGSKMRLLVPNGRRTWVYLGDGVRVRHLGFSSHENNGRRSASVLVRCDSMIWKLRLKPFQMFYVVEIFIDQAVFRTASRYYQIPEHALCD